MEPWQPRPLLLASGSPRRKELLESAGFSFRVIRVDCEEVIPPEIPAEQAAGYLAEKKSHAAFPLLEPGEILLTADSVVILDGCILDKPGDLEEAADHLRRLSGRTHTVMTGICLRDGSQAWTGLASTQVSVEPLTEPEIRWYLGHGHPLDKAGGYGIQEWLGLCRIRKIEGSYPNVVGLPVHLVYEGLQAFAALPIR